MEKLSPESWLVKAARPEEPGAPLNTPIIPSSNFLKGAGIQYSREDSTPTWNALETIVGELEGGECVAYSSGMAAAAAVFAQLAVGSKIAIADDCYHGVTKLAAEGQAQGRWRVQRVAVADTEGWKAAMLDSDLVWLESPSNPLLVLADLQAIGSAPRKPGCLLALDNTVATPLNQQPLKFGADISMHSGTKYIGGHSDLLMGLLVAKDPGLASRFRHARLLHGATPGALEAYLATRGLRTLAIRLERAQTNALKLATYLEQHPAIENVRYPGVDSHPQHALARSQMNGFSGLISFEVKAGGEAADHLCNSTRLISHATSLGSVESTIERRSAQKGQEHLAPGLIRLSVGIENADELQADLEQALGR
ncbi:MAG: PLP-dependent transferase [Xanthomonadales bacterium]|nr:PLP-dependent transferase [Xanthomonadales bacterium]